MNPTDLFVVTVTRGTGSSRCLSPSKPQRGRMDSKSYALLAQWLNGMSFAVNSYLIPIQLVGKRKRNAIDTMYPWHFCLSPSF